MFSSPRTALATVLLFGLAGGLAVEAHADLPNTSKFISGPDSFTLDTFLNTDKPLTLYGVTLYGTLDLGMTDLSHAAGYSPDYPQSVNYAMSSSAKNVTAGRAFFTHSIMEQTKAGIYGTENVLDGLDVVFRFETQYNPISGVLVNGQKSLIDNAGQKFGAGTRAASDSARDGQVFNGMAYGGIHNSTFGTLTFGDHATPLKDLFLAYDPQELAYGYSFIGFSSTYAGGGDTEDTRLDHSIKYTGSYGPARVAALYQLPHNANSSGGDEAIQFDLGYDYQSLSVDVIFAQKKDAINISNPPTSASSTLSNQLIPTVSDNNTWGFFAKYKLNPLTFFGAYEHIVYLNPGTPLTAASESSPSLGGYEYSSIIDNNYTTAKILHVLWYGARYDVTEDINLRVANYILLQDNYSGVDQSVCVAKNSVIAGSVATGTCAGTEEVVSLAGDYRFNKRFDLYAGVMYSKVMGGLYLDTSDIHSNILATSAGLRFKF